MTRTSSLNLNRTNIKWVRLNGYLLTWKDLHWWMHVNGKSGCLIQPRASTQVIVLGAIYFFTMIWKWVIRYVPIAEMQDMLSWMKNWGGPPGVDTIVLHITNIHHLNTFLRWCVILQGRVIGMYHRISWRIVGPNWVVGCTLQATKSFERYKEMGTGHITTANTKLQHDFEGGMKHVCRIGKLTNWKENISGTAKNLWNFKGYTALARYQTGGGWGFTGPCDTYWLGCVNRLVGRIWQSLFGESEGKSVW